MRTSGILRCPGTLTERRHAREALRYRRRQPPKAVGTRGKIRKAPSVIFDKIFDKPQPPRVQRSQILVSMLTRSRSTPGVLRGCRPKFDRARSACRRDTGEHFCEMPARDDVRHNAAKFSLVFGPCVAGNSGNRRVSHVAQCRRRGRESGIAQRSGAWAVPSHCIAGKVDATEGAEANDRAAGLPCTAPPNGKVAWTPVLPCRFAGMIAIIGAACGRLAQGNV
jgi:hypothetical protein